MKRFFRMWAVVMCYGLILATTDTAGQSGFGMVEIVAHDQNGARISNADLCLAMPGQNARKMTDSNGSYKTTLPVGTTTIHVSRNGYANTQETVIMANGANLVRFIQLQPGQSTPLPADCGSITATTIPGNSCDVIAAVQATGGTTTTDRRVQVRVELKDRPYAFRIAEFSPAETIKDHFDPDDAFRKHNIPWQPVAGPAAGALTTFFNLSEPGYGTHAIYVQTQRYQSGCVSRSRVLSVVLAPANFQTHTLKGSALEHFVTEAKARGYEFRTRMNVFQRGDRCQPGFYSLWPENFNNPRSPLGGDKNRLDQEVTAKFEAFGGPLLLNPFWTIEQGRAEHPSFPNYIPPGPLDPNRNNTVMVYEKFGQSGCPHGCQQSPMREFSWARKIYGYVALSGTRAQGGTEFCDRERDASLTELVLRGPAGQNPIDALEDLRIFNPDQLRLAPPPRTILPRGVEEKEGTAGGEPPAEPTAPDAQP